jgi:hypothetical protein
VAADEGAYADGAETEETDDVETGMIGAGMAFKACERLGDVVDVDDEIEEADAAGRDADETEGACSCVADCYQRHATDKLKTWQGCTDVRSTQTQQTCVCSTTGVTTTSSYMEKPLLSSSVVGFVS